MKSLGVFDLVVGDGVAEVDGGVGGVGGGMGEGRDCVVVRGM